MVIHNYKGGQLANRVVLFAHFLANSIEHKYELRNPEFDEYNAYFEGTSKNEFNGYPISVTLFKSHFFDRAFSRLFRLWADITHLLFTKTPFYTLYRIFRSHDKKNIVFDLNDPVFVKDAQTKRVITEGWLFRDYASFNKYENDIRQFFTPVEKYKAGVEQVIAAARMQADTVVAVHIRRGDYIRYAAGRWFFDDAVYADKMMQLQNKMASKGKSCIFLICSNDTVNIENFPAELTMIIEKRHFIVDMYCLAASDIILGPPSTFSIWASFYGKVQLIQIDSKDDVIELKEYVNLC